MYRRGAFLLNRGFGGKGRIAAGPGAAIVAAVDLGGLLRGESGGKAVSWCGDAPTGDCMVCKHFKERPAVRSVEVRHFAR